MDQHEALELFNKWFVKPIEILEGQIGSDAGWVALMVTLPLYERLIRAKLREDKKDSSDKAMFDWMASDLHIEKEQAEAFWWVMRSGLAHQAMPQSVNNQPRGKKTKAQRETKYRYVLHSDYPQILFFGEYSGEPAFYLNPMIFAKRVLELWQTNPELIAADKEFPFASVVPADMGQLRKHCSTRDVGIPTENADSHPLRFSYADDNYDSLGARSVDVNHTQQPSVNTKGTVEPRG